MNLPDLTDSKAFWEWRDAHPHSCTVCGRANLEVFECAWSKGECLHCCGCWNISDEHEQYTYEETEESEV